MGDAIRAIDLVVWGSVGALVGGAGALAWGAWLIWKWTGRR